MTNDEFTSSTGLPNPSLSQTSAAQTTRQPLIHLTPRESEIVRYVMLGESNKQIARRLGISNYTVRDHVSNLLKKSGVTSRSRLALVLPPPLAQPAAVASRAGPINPISIAARPAGHSLHDASVDRQIVGLPWRK
ncbi:MAG: LuxR C-terminal-related transcriptional regulator [Burkholderiaceae bacterium]